LRRHAVLLAVAALGGAGSACGGTLPPLRSFAEVGEDRYAVFVADGPDGRGELYALLPDGGEARQLTFTPVAEAAPALSPDGTVLAFLRSEAAGDEPESAWALNLANGAERRLELPRGARPTAIGWRRDGTALYVATAAGDTLRLAPPPAASAAAPAAGAERAEADSALAVLVGSPPAGRVAPCEGGRGICVRTAEGITSLSPEGASPARWGADSLAWVERDRVLVRPLGGGHTRQISVARMPRSPRDFTFFDGARRR
jgi:hypothetical protein